MEKKPDFRSAAIAHVAKIYGSCKPNDHPDYIRVDSFVAGCEYVYTPLQSQNERLLSALKELKAFCVQEIAITENQLQIFKRDKNRDMKARCESSISTYEKILELLLINDSGER